MPKTAQKLDWKKDGYGNEYANYKLGVIRRVNKNSKTFNVSLGYNSAQNAGSLAAAKKKIDVYTAKKIKELK